jgi:Uma2 family endonuclease
MSTLASMPAIPTQPARPIRIPSPLYRMSLEQYESLIATGFFTKHDDVHLINGYVVNRMAESPLHGTVCEAIRMAMGAILLAVTGWHTRSEKGVRIPSQVSIPRPDLAVVRGEWREYLTRYPDAADVAMVAEVSISSLDEDRAKADIYAAGGIPVYWIVDVDDGQVEVYSDPGPSGYQSHEVLAPGHVLSVVIDGVVIGEIAVADLLP